MKWYCNYVSLMLRYYRGAHGIMFVYDVTVPETFTSINRWLNEAISHCNTDIVKLLVGNKDDNPSRKCVTTEEAQKFAEEHGMRCCETSAMLNTNVDKVSCLHFYN